MNEENRDAAAVACYIVLLAAHDRGLGGYWRTPGVLTTPAGPGRAAGSRTARRSSACSTSARPRARSPHRYARRSRRSSPTSRDRPRTGSWRAGGRRMRLGGEPLLMGIVNASPDSFPDAGELPDTAARDPPRYVLVAAGARIVDVGGETARGGLEPVAVEAEIERVVPVVAAVAAELDVLVSVDTYKPEGGAGGHWAGARSSTTSPGSRDPRLAESAPGQAPRSSSCTRPWRPSGSCSTEPRRVVAASRLARRAASAPGGRRP